MEVKDSKWAVFMAFWLYLYIFLIAKEEISMMDSQRDAFMFI